MKARLGVAATLVVGGLGISAVTTRVDAAKGAGLATVTGPVGLPCLGLQGSCDDFYNFVTYTDRTMTDNRVTVRTSATVPVERVRIEDPGVVIAGDACPPGVGSTVCEGWPYVVMRIDTADGNDVITVVGGNTRVEIDCGPGTDKVVRKWGGRASTRNCEQVV